MTDPFHVLGVARDATEDDIKRAFRKFALDHHPDRNPGDETAPTRFQAYRKAYEDAMAAVRAENDPRREQARRQGRNMDRHGTVAVTLEDAYHGCDVTAVANDGITLRVRVPAGIENDMRLRVTGMGDATHTDLPPGDMFLHVRIHPHPVFRRRGHRLEVDLVVHVIDAMTGATLPVPTIDGTPLTVTLAPGTHQDHRIIVPGHGMPVPGRDARGPLEVRIVLRVPEVDPLTATSLRALLGLN